MNNFINTESQIIRVKHSNNFTQLSNDMLRDKSISWKAKGLLGCIMSLPDEWTIKKTTLFQFSKDGRDSTIAAFNELVSSGYALEVKSRVKGKFSVKYIVSDKPLRNFRNGLSDSDNKEQINTEEVNTEEINTLELKTTASAVVKYNTSTVTSLDEAVELLTKQY